MLKHAWPVLAFLTCFALFSAAHASTTVEIYHWPSANPNVTPHLPSGLTPWNVVGDGSNTGVIQVRPTDQSSGWQDIVVFQHASYHHAYDGLYDGYSAFGSNGSVDVRIVYQTSLTTQTTIFPDRLDIPYQLSTTKASNDTMTFTLPSNANVLIGFADKNGLNSVQSLALFNNPLSVDPGSTAPNTDYYAANTVNTYRHTTNQNIYVAPGAIVTLAGSYPLGLGSNTTLYGYGIVLQTDNNQVVATGSATNVQMSGVILDNQSGPPGVQGNWTFAVTDSMNVTVDNVKLFDESYGEDGIDLVCTSFVTIKNSFLRVDDDGVTLKATTYNNDTTKSPSQNITIKNNFFLIGNFGNVVHVGALNGQESYSTAADKNFTNLLIDTNDVVTSSGSPGDALLNMQTDGGTSINNITLQNMNVDDSYYVTPANLQVGTASPNTGIGSISGVTIQNVQIDDFSYLTPATVQGYNSTGTVSNVAFNAISLDGSLATNPSTIFNAGSYTSNITLGTTATSTGLATGNGGGTGSSSVSNSPAFFTESFSYSPGNLTGHGGWSGATAYQVIGTSLAYTDSTGAALGTSGGSAKAFAYYPGGISCALPQSIGAAGTTAYWSFLYAASAGDQLALVDSTGAYHATISVVNGTWQIATAGQTNDSRVPANGTAFFVVRLDFGTGQVRYRLYVNPILSSETANTAQVDVGEKLTSPLTAIGWTEGYYTNQALDEIRLGNSWSGVTVSSSPSLVSALSQQVQGSATFGLPLALTGTPTIEPREGSTPGSYTLVLNFSSQVTAANVALQLQSGQTGSPVYNSQATTAVISGTTVTVGLSGVGDAQRLNLHVTGVQPGNGTADVPINILWGKVNGTGAVNVGDALTVRANATKNLLATNFIYDINCSGAIDIGDALLTRTLVGTSLP